MKVLALALAACMVLAVSAKEKNYFGYSVYRIEVENDTQADFLHELETSGEFDFWTDVRRQGSVDIMTSPVKEKHLVRQLNGKALSYRVMIEDVQPLIQATRMAQKKNKQSDHDMDWTSYHDLDDIYTFWDYVEANYDYASTESIGQSYEGRDMRMMKICKDGCGNKPAMYIDGGIHAREWIAVATVTYFVNMLTDGMDTDSQYLIDQLDWYILPSVNPDGYAFTQSDDRFWRKTRSPNDGSICIGTDANRNFGFHWDEGGASDTACSDTYHGDSAFSEIETQHVQDFIDANAEQIKFFDSIHSYSQYVLIPYGYTEEPCPNYQDLEDLANRGVDALTAMYGTEYTVGCIPCILYVASGGACDYALGTDHIKYAYSMELRDQGRYGFLLPEDQITPTAEETWAFHVSAANDIIAEFGA